MNKRDHIFAGMFITGLLHITLSFIYHGDTSSATNQLEYIYLFFSNGGILPHPNTAWLFGALLGSIWADLDFTFVGSKGHRNSFFHSAMFQLIIFSFYLFDGTYLGLTYMFVHFFIASSTHLFLDLVPTSIPDEFSRNIWSRWEFRIGRVRKGYVGSSIKRPPISVSSHKNQRTWFLVNGAICLLLGILSLIQLITGFTLA